MSSLYLKRKKIRRENGWTTVPDPKHRQSVINKAGYGERASGATVGTPGVNRKAEAADEQLLNGALMNDFQSAVGSSIFLSIDMEMRSYSTRENARAIHAPTFGDLYDLRRQARWLQQTGDWVHDKRIDDDLKPKSAPRRRPRR